MGGGGKLPQTRPLVVPSITVRDVPKDLLHDLREAIITTTSVALRERFNGAG